MRALLISLLLVSHVPGCSRFVSKVNNYQRDIEAQTQNQTALMRAKNGCVVTQRIGMPSSYLVEGEMTRDESTGLPLRPGLTICTELGDTAVVDETGRSTDIARVTDMTEFESLLRSAE